MNVNFSLEVFPPKSPEGNKQFYESLERYLPLNPSFLSVTCTNDPKSLHTKKACNDLKNKVSNVAAHMTCVGQSKSYLEELADYYWDNGVHHIVALRGDDHKNEIKKGCLTNACDLVELLKKRHDFEITVAGYPEGHPESLSYDIDIAYLKHKVDCGVDRVVSQFFFDPDKFLVFRDACYKQGIRVPIVPGLLPIRNFAQTCRFAKSCGLEVPDFLKSMFSETENFDQDQALLSMNILSHQVTKLNSEGINNFHLYTLNETLISYHLCHWMSVAF